MSKHTPGPWTVVESAGGFIIRKGSKQFMGGEANARLMAAAPLMLEALKFSLEEWGQYDIANEPGGPSDRARLKVMATIRKAIAKAEGK